MQGEDNDLGLGEALTYAEIMGRRLDRVPYFDLTKLANGQPLLVCARRHGTQCYCRYENKVILIRGIGGFIHEDPTIPQGANRLRR